MKKKILFVIDSLGSGGAEKSLISLLTLFDYSKYDVDLLLFSKQGLYFSLVPKEVNIIEVPQFLNNQRKSINTLIKEKNFKDLYIKLRKYIDLRNSKLNNKFHSAQLIWKWSSKNIESIKKDYDVAIAYSQGFPTYYIANKVNANKKIAWINTDYKKAKYNKEFDIYYYNKFNNIVAVSDYCKKSILEIMPEVKGKLKVIYDIISPRLINEMANEKGGFADDFDGIRILTIGRLVELKGYDMAIEAADMLKKSGVKFRWYSLGEGELKEELENKVKKFGLGKDFIFLGVTKNPYTYLKQCDIYVQPSRFEGFGLAIAEAKILSKPIVATNFTIVYNQINNEKNGIIVNMNSNSIFLGIEKLLKNKILFKNVIENLKCVNGGTEKEIFSVYSMLDYI